METKKKSEVKSRDILVLSRKDPELGERWNKTGFVIRVVEWLFEKKDGTTGSSISLEKRELYFDEDEAIKNGKAKGFTRAEFEMLRNRADEIDAALAGAPAKPKWEKPTITEVKDPAEKKKLTRDEELDSGAMDQEPF